MPAHAKYAASAAHRWMKCPGSVQASEGIHAPTSFYAAEGTAAHAVAAEMLLRGPLTLRQTVEGYEIETTDEMKEAVTIYVSALRAEHQALEDSELYIEQQFSLDEQVHPNMGGTSDAVILSPRRLSVWDLKYGQGIIVSPEENEQMMMYGLGALLKTNARVDEVELVIAQPRGVGVDPIRRWVTTPGRLLDFALELKTAALKAEEPNPELVPGEHCRFCPAAARCPAIREQAMTLARNEFGPISAPDQPAMLSRTLEWLPTLEEWIENVKLYAIDQLKQGNAVPGFKLVNKRATRKWSNALTPLEIARAITQTTRIQAEKLFTEPELKSPAQVEKLLSKEQRIILGTMVTQESSGVTLAPDADDRPAVRQDPRAEFARLPAP